jgi:D-alanyl-D-alanine carboxypeptidase/D-alanyl-D-alanine-endopeptidase (penicillin-binding protein 4)
MAAARPVARGAEESAYICAVQLPARPRGRTLALFTLLAALLGVATGASASRTAEQAVGASTQATPAPPNLLRALQIKLSADLRRAGGVGGALVVDTNTGETLFSASAHAERIPASVQKLYTTSTALLELGPTATLSTTVLGVGALDPRGVWRGTLYLRGGGDPTFGSAGFDSASYGRGVGATVQRLASSIRRAGIRAVRGAIIGDESYLDSVRGTPATGMAPDLEVEGELSALAFNDGFLSRAATNLQPRPALFATRQFVAALRGAGVRVPASIKIFTGRTPATAKQLAMVSSPPLSTLLHLTNATSDNFFAELLLKDLGARFGAGGTTADGSAVVAGFIRQRFGIDPRFNDGSGLSRYDLSSPLEVVSLLEQMQSNSTFVNSLAIAGVSGTMQQEMLGTRAVGNCRGKTGTLNDVANLVGYCTDRNGDTLAFAFMLNSIASSYKGHLMEDHMGVALANYAGVQQQQSSPTGGTPTVVRHGR